MPTNCSRLENLVSQNRGQEATSAIRTYGLTSRRIADSNVARDSFRTFIPLSVENGARQRIIFDFFDLMSAIAAHGKSNGLGGRKLSRMAAWWAFEQKDTGSGFEGGYNSWLR
jgi:hypothetical protein